MSHTTDRSAREVLGESIVDEVRAIREEIDESVGHDVKKLAELARRRGEALRREFGLKMRIATVDKDGVK